MKMIKTTPVWIAMALTAMATTAQSESFTVRAKVIDAKPIYETVAYREPVEICDYHYSDHDHYHDQSNVTGAVVGGVVGAAIGSQITASHHGDSVAGTIVGGVLGATVGSQVATSKPQYQHKQCHLEYDSNYHEELVGYRVTYRYEGKEYQTRMQHNPGRFVRLRVEVSLLDD